jgi:hypothetical protein
MITHLACHAGWPSVVTAIAVAKDVFQAYPARNMGATIVGNLFKPARFDAYAQHLAEQGFITLAVGSIDSGQAAGP